MVISLHDSVVIITENAEGKLYLISQKTVQDIIDDWKGDCEYVPENDAGVYFASCNNKPVDPHLYTDFESLLSVFCPEIASRHSGGNCQGRNSMSYRGYNGSVEYSKEEHCLYGRILGIKTLLTYEGESVRELEQHFKDAVDSYLED